MAILLGFLLIVSVIGLICLLVALLISHRSHARLEQEAHEQQVQLEAQLGQLKEQAARLSRENTRLAKWTSVADADETANALIANANATLAQAESDARILVTDAERRATELMARAEAAASEETSEARSKAKEFRDDAQALIDTAMRKAADVVTDAETRAEEIAGEAYAALRNAALYEKTAKAMKNIIDGYGDEYLVPVHSLLADLAEEFGHAEAGQELKRVRAHTKMMIKSGAASKCEYVEQNRREMAERFVLDAFNGKTDSILTRVKHDNAGKLSQEIHDAFTMVNFNGKAFRDARVTEQYLASRLDELKWAAIVHELKRQEQDEQRRIREQIREEEKGDYTFGASDRRKCRG